MLRSIATTDGERQTLAGLVANIGYEIMPFANAVEKVLSHVPTEVPLTVTATGGKGIERTLEVAVALRQEGYSVAPHLPARLISGSEELNGIVERLKEAAVDRVFVIAGDAEQAAGPFDGALDLLRALQENGQTFDEVGIAGYPEGHALFTDGVVDEALLSKAPHAHRILTQICFSPEAVLSWGSRIASDGVGLPVYAGMPGPVSRQKLMRISASLGLGPSAQFLKKQQNMVWKFFSPSGYRPTRLIRGLVRGLPETSANLRGFHIFTFNEVQSTERWRQELLALTR